MPDSIINAPELRDSLQKPLQKPVNNKLQHIEEALAFSNNLADLFEQEIKKLPYHVNLLDIVEPNENDHSRILGQLLKQNKNGVYEILDSFLEYCLNNRTDKRLKSQKPRITCGAKMIDLLIVDSGFAIIIENKIYDAVDGKAQIAHYINQVKSDLQCDFKDIYVIYLTRDDSKEVSKQSWILKDTDYSDEFSERYFPLTYRTDILPWLQEAVLPNVRLMDVFLKSAIEQYIDCLEGMYKIRKINTTMNSEIEKQIITFLELNDNPEQNLKKINAQIDQLTQTQDKLREIKRNFQKQCFNNWISLIKIKFPDYEIVDKSDSMSYPKIGIKMEYKGHPLNVLIEFDNHDKVYYGIGRHYASQDLIPEVKEKFKTILTGYRTNSWWYGFRYMPVNEIGDAYIEFVKSVIKELK